MDYVQIKGYKSIRNAYVTINPINILIGANGSGKSNFISFFEFLNRAYDQKLQEYIALSGGAEKILHKGSKYTDSIHSKIGFGRNAYSFTLKKGDPYFVFTHEGLWYDGNPHLSNPTEIAQFGSESRIKVFSLSRADYIRRYLNGLKKYHFHDTSKNSPFTQMSHIKNDCYFLYEKGENLAAFLYMIRETHRVVYGRIIKVIQNIAPFFSDFFFQPNAEGYVSLQWQDKYSSTVYGASDFSDGTVRFIALATLFLQPVLPSSIIIDEPELGLHPFALTKLAGMIQSVSTRNVQVIVATQSTDLVNHFQPEDIITVDQRNGESVFNRLSGKDLETWLEDYSIGDLWQRNIIKGGQP